MNMLTNSKGETHPMPAHGDSYDGPTLSFDPETKLYIIVYLGCQIGDPIDIVGEREKMRSEAARGGGP
jgi:hypothetical protein